MLDTLMDISEAETGTMRLDAHRRRRLTTLVGEVVSVYEDVAEEKAGRRLDTTWSAGLTVSADRDRLRQVLANLLDNAIKYTPAGRHASRSAAMRDGTTMRASRSPTPAPASPPHDLPRIWERLYRGDQSRAERGLGLGLSLVRAIVAAHGGTVEVRTEPGKGSTFTLRPCMIGRPRADAPLLRSRAPTPARSQATSRRVGQALLELRSNEPRTPERPATLTDVMSGTAWQSTSSTCDRR